MDSLIRQGKVLYWGTSEWRASDIEALIAFADRNRLIPPQVKQPQYNLFHRERVEHEYRSIAETHGVGLTTWSPLASGVLAGRYDDGIPPGSRLTAAGFSWLSDFVFAGRQEEMRAAARRLQDIAADIGSSRAQFAIAWCLANPLVSTVILGASSKTQLAHNLTAIEFVEKLTPEIRESISPAMSFKPDRPI